MKKLLLGVLCGTMALAASAHRDVYFTHNFSNAPDFGHASWSFKGAQGEFGETEYLLICDGSLQVGGNLCVQISHDQRTNGNRKMPNIDQVRLTFLAASDNGDAQMTPRVVLIDEEGARFTFNFDMAQDDAEVMQEMISKSHSDLSEMGQINEFHVYFDNAVEGQIIAPVAIALCSDWSMPVVSPFKEVYSKKYGFSEVILEDEYQKGVTYIQAEDFDEPWINGRTAHSRIQGSNNSYDRLFPEDRNVQMAVENGGMFADGSHWSKWVQGHGHVVSNRFQPEGGGACIADFIPTGGDWYRYYGEYTHENYVTTENAIKNFGAWTEYTFDVPSGCDIDLSICAGTHRAAFDPIISTGSSCWYEAPDDFGYVLEEYPNKEYFELFGYKWIVSLDGVELRTAHESAPLWCNDGNVFELNTLNPATWTNTQEVVDGQTVNSKYLHIYPCAWVGIENKDTTPGDMGHMWWTYYKVDILKLAMENGFCTEAEYNNHNHPDYMNITLTPGRHTLKVQNLGGNAFFDEIRIDARMNDGVENVLSDGNNTPFQGSPIYFDLNGRRVNNPENGIFIVKRGNSISKEVVR